MTRRQLLRTIGLGAGSAAMYQAMASLGLAAESTFTGTPKLGAAPPGASVLVLGAGIAGMVAELAAGLDPSETDQNARQAPRAPRQE